MTLALNAVWPGDSAEGFGPRSPTQRIRTKLVCQRDSDQAGLSKGFGPMDSDHVNQLKGFGPWDSDQDNQPKGFGP